MIYYDNAATTFPCREAEEAAKETIRAFEGNPSSLHRLGTSAHESVEGARRRIAAALRCSEKEILFTSCATESINTVLKGFHEAYPRSPGTVVTSSAEHKATLECCAWLEKKGFRVLYLDPDRDGSVSAERLSQVCGPDTGLITLMHVNNETGAVTDLPAIARVRDAQCPDARIHIDAVQSFGKIPFAPSKTGIDYASMSAHKLHGLKGAGALFAAARTRIAPLLHGGGQENGLRSGTENVPAIAAFGAAAQIASGHLAENLERARKVREVFLQGLGERGAVWILNSPEGGSPYILNLSFPGVMPEILLHALEAEEVYISTASACASRSAKVSHVLKAMGIPDRTALYAVRLSFGSENTVDEAAEAAEIFSRVLGKIPRKK